MTTRTVGAFRTMSTARQRRAQAFGKPLYYLIHRNNSPKQALARVSAGWRSTYPQGVFWPILT